MAKKKAQKQQPVLKYDEETVRTVDYKNWNKFVNAIYNVKNYQFVISEGCSNDSSHRFISEPSGSEECLKHVNERIADFIDINGNDSFVTGDIFEDLCNRGLIDPGTYIISVCW